MKHKLFVLLPVAALLVAGVTPVVAKTITTHHTSARYFGVRPPHDDAKRDEKLASALGITVDDLKARLLAGKTPEQIATDLGISQTDFQKKMHDAMVADMKARLASDVAAGKITQAQADTKLAQMQTDVASEKFSMGPGKGHMMGMGMDKGEHAQVLAQALGITTDDLKARFEAGKRLPDILKDLGIDQADFDTKIHAAHVAEIKIHLQQMVTDGKITQAEADKKFALIQTDSINAKLPLGPRMMRGDREHFTNTGSDASLGTTK